MTKFVAALFLPFVAVVAFVSQPGGFRRLLSKWSDWVLPVLLVLASVPPRFVYQWSQEKENFWAIIFGTHVYTRFTASLDPSHLRSWHYYFTQAWLELEYADSLILVVGGLVLLSWHAWRGHPALARLLLLWWLLPFLLISIGASKLFHYTYPFLPPLALGAGWLCVRLLHLIDARLFALPDSWRLDVTAFVRDRPRLRVILLSTAAVAGMLAIWTMITGQPTIIMMGETRIFSNSSVPRPLIIAILLTMLATDFRATGKSLVILALLLLLPLQPYEAKVRRVFSIDRPLAAVRDCILSQQASGDVSRGGVYLTDPNLVAHPYFYYFRTTGPYKTGPEGSEQEVQARLFDPASQTPIIMSSIEWHRLRAALPPPPSTADVTPRPDPIVRELAALQIEPTVVLLLPGEYSACQSAMLASGSRVSRQ